MESVAFFAPAFSVTSCTRIQAIARERCKTSRVRAVLVEGGTRQDAVCFAAFVAAGLWSLRQLRSGVQLRATRVARNARPAKAMPMNTKTYPAKELCSRCGLCNTSLVGSVKSACAFIGEGMGRIDAMEEKVHGRRRDLDSENELYFGVSKAIRLAKVPEDHRPVKRAWTGVITTIACEMLRSGRVDAVLCVAAESSDRPLEPRPILARTVEEVLSCGGVKPVLSPNLAPLEELLTGNSRDVKRLLFIGVGCQVQALRAVEKDLGLEALYVLGTNCVDNPRSLEALQRFLRSASDAPETATGFEFMQDNRIHVKHTDGHYERVPIFSLKNPHTCTGVIAKSCYSCFDYVNALTDVTVGYMAAPWEGGKMTEHSQYIVIRNAQGQEMVDIAVSAGLLELSESTPAGGGIGREGLIPSVLGPELDLAFGLRKPKDPPPTFLANLLSEVLTALGPKGLDFAKASIDRAILRNIVCTRSQNESSSRRGEPQNLPAHASAIEDRYKNLLNQMLQKYGNFSLK